jgi:GNAT superfamily N-acetyltransferase
MEIVRLPESQIDLAGAAMARAFFDDPVSVYTYPDEAERRRLAPWHFSTFIRYAHSFGEVYTTNGTPLGSAVWLPPGQAEIDPEFAHQAGLDRAAEVLGEVAWRRFGTICDYVDALQPLEVPGPHWSLPLLGVDPTRQGQGVGSALLRPILERADADGLPAYLWTAKSRNVPFYRRHGFEVVTEGVEPTSSVRFWTMRRLPRAASINSPFSL